MADPPFRLLDPVSWPMDTRTRSKRHLVGDGGTPPDGRGARTICGKALPLGTAPDPDEARERCAACWQQLARNGAAFYTEREHQPAAASTAPPAAPLSVGDLVAWTIWGSTKHSRRHRVAAPAPDAVGRTWTLCGRVVPNERRVTPAHAPADCARCRALRRAD